MLCGAGLERSHPGCFCLPAPLRLSCEGKGKQLLRWEHKCPGMEPPQTLRVIFVILQEAGVGSATLNCDKTQNPCLEVWEKRALPPLPWQVRRSQGGFLLSACFLCQQWQVNGSSVAKIAPCEQQADKQIRTVCSPGEPGFRESSSSHQQKKCKR